MYKLRIIPPIVSTDWLNENIDALDIIVIDIRSRKEFIEGHIPRSINIPFDPLKSAWSIVRDELLLEIPSLSDLFYVIELAGLSKNSKVVIVNRADSIFSRADALRVAVELIYVGINNVAILDGGIDKWIKEGKRIVKDNVFPIPSHYTGNVKEDMFVSKHYVLEKVGKAIIVDARDPDVYFGISIEPWSQIPGHIPTAKNLPAQWIWVSEGLFRPMDILKKIVEGVVGIDRDREIIVYCGVGGYASAIWYILAQVFEYVNAKIYDGGWQEWVKEPVGPISIYKWE